MPKSKPYPGTQAVIRALSLLKAFNDERPEWGLTELSEAVGLNKTTTFRLLTALESEGMIGRNSNTDAYHLGTAVITMGGYALRTNDLRTICQPELKALAATAQETAALELLTGAETLILDEVMGDRVMSGGQAIGTRWAAHATSTGKAILAQLPPPQLQEILSLPLQAVTSYTITDWDTLVADLSATVTRGYAIANEELEVGLAAVAAPLFNYDGEVVAAISLAGPKIRIAPARIPQLGELVCEAAQRISAQLGWRP